MQSNLMYLTEDQKTIWAKAGSAFPGEQLHQIVYRVIADVPQMMKPNENVRQSPTHWYEIRRLDVPNGFESLLKLQSTGLAKRHMEMDEHGSREVLRIDVIFLDIIMTALKMILDVFLRLVGDGLKTPKNSTGGISPTFPEPPNPAQAGRKYVPHWKRHMIKYDGPAPFS